MSDLRLGRIASLIVLSGVVTMVAGFTLVFMVGLLKGDAAQAPAEITLPILLVGGVVTLLLNIVIIVVLFGELKLSDPRHALGLPEGSLQAVIALLFILIFAIMGLFLYSSQLRPETRTSKGLNAEQLKAIPSDQIVSQLPGASPNTFDVERRLDNLSSADIAKQLITTLSTLVAAISAFYFGARTAERGRDREVNAAAAAVPIVRVSDPSSPVRMSVTKGETLSPITVETLPLGQNVIGTIVRGDPDGQLRKSPRGVFEYERGTSPEDEVVLRFALEKNPTIHDDLTVLKK